jgi:hypothetical protein
MIDPLPPRPRGDRLDSVECAACGTPVAYRGTGRPAKYRGDSCRRTGWALHRAAQTLHAGDDLRPEVVRETVIRERLRTPPR